MGRNIEEIVLFQIDKTNKIAKAYSQREFDKENLGITIEQWVLLKIIEETKEISQKELSIKSLRDPASITRSLDILEKKLLIQRELIPENRRQHNVILTKKGVSFVHKHMEMVKEHRALSVKGFSKDELNTLSSLLKRIQENMK